MKKILLLLFVAFFFSSCEKDDICSEDTTPRLIIEFYDIANPANTKNVSSLKVTGVGQSVPLKTHSGVSKIELPLNITTTSTKYSLITNSSISSLIPNEDFLEFNYVHQNIYVSRACGYKTTFDLNTTDGVLLTDAASPDLLWIQDINIRTTNIDNENETHIKIYF